MRYSFLSFFLPFTGYPYRGERVDCPGCSHGRHFVVASFDRRFKRLPTVACERCGLLFVCPMPTDQELEIYYSKYYRLDYQAVSTGPTNKHLEKRRREAQMRFDALNGLLPSSARTLDFGCGSGEFVTMMLAAGHDAHGFEPGESYGNYARALHGDRITVKGWKQVEYDQTFDLVTCFHVLEHLNEPHAALESMARWAKPEGFIYIEVPDMAPPRNKGFGGFHFGHLTGFNHHNLIVAAARAGLGPVRMVTPTGIVFSRDAKVDPEAEAAAGLALTKKYYSDGRASSNYWRYQWSKVVGDRG